MEQHSSNVATHTTCAFRVVVPFLKGEEEEKGGGTWQQQHRFRRLFDRFPGVHAHKQAVEDVKSGRGKRHGEKVRKKLLSREDEREDIHNVKQMTWQQQRCG